MMLGCKGLRIKAHFWKASQIWTQQVKIIFNVFPFVTILVKGEQKIKQICLKLNTTFSLAELQQSLKKTQRNI